MLKATWRRLGLQAWLAIGLVGLIPNLAQAQLFPNRPIRRERPPCSSEPPFNAQVRRDYFGYYPTCWTRFPSGWACPCPNPELPDMARSIKEIGEMGQRRVTPEGDRRPGLDDPNPATDPDGMPANPATEPGTIPLPNPGRSPFDTDPSPKGPGTDPSTNPNPAGPGGRPSSSAGLMEMPKLPETTPSARNDAPSQAGAMSVFPEATLTSGEAADVRPDLGPLPTASVPVSSNPTASAAPNDQPVLGTPAPAQAPKRRGFLSGLFGSKNTRNR